MNNSFLAKWLCVLLMGICLNSSAVFLQQAKIINTDVGDFGCSIAVSGDGNTVVVGADALGRDKGAVYIYTRSGTTRINTPNGLYRDDFGHWYGDNFGGSVALSSDGNTVVVGAHGATVGGNMMQGAAYVFTRSGTGWTRQATLVASDGAILNFFGSSVAMSSDGNIAIVGAFEATVGRNQNQGAVYVFTRSGTHWTRQAKLVASDGKADNGFGISVALSSVGNTAIVGTTKGAAYVFARSGSAWAQQSKLGAIGDVYGIFVYVELSKDGNTAIAGAAGAAGAAYVFARSGGHWTQQAKLVASDGTAGDEFGSCVAISSDGNAVIVGAAGAGSRYQGAAYVFTRSGAAWSQRSKIIASDNAPVNFFGSNVAMSPDGNTVFVTPYPSFYESVYMFVNSQIQFESPAYIVSKNVGNVTVVATRSNSVSGVTSVHYATTDGTALAGTDYITAAGTLSWASWNADNKTITIPILSRTGINASRDFDVNLTDDSGAVFDSTTVTITDNTPVPTPPAGVMASYDFYIDRVRIGGSATAETTGYEVWRGTSAYTNQAMRIGAATNYYDDMTATAGITYFYWLKSTNATGVSAFSTTALGRVLIGPDMRVNRSAGPLTVAADDELAVTVSMNPKQYAGVPVDLWILAVAPSGLYYLNSMMLWTPASNVSSCRPVYQGELFELQSGVVLDTTTLPIGTYTFFFGVDALNGRLDPDVIYDSAVVTVAL